MTIIPIDSERIEKMQQVVELSLTGMTDTAVAKKLNIPRKVAIELFDEWKTALANDVNVRDMGRDYLSVMMKHFDILIKKNYDLIVEIDDQISNTSFSHQWAGQKAAVIKAIAELESKRLDAIQKAGLLDANNIGDELAEMEEKHEILIGILRNDLCPTCRLNVANKLQKVTQQVEAVVVYDNE